MADIPFHFFGIRHHGPGCARSLIQALEHLQPDCLLIEGPPEGEAVLPIMADADLEPPVALLVYNPDDSRQAAFYPFAVFSPEWNALHYGLAHGIPTRFIDLPMSHQFALAPPEPQAVAADEIEPDNQPTGAVSQAEAEAESSVAVETDPRLDPLDWLGRAAGYGDGESWWNHLVEERGDSLELFAAIREAMTTVRAETPGPERSAVAQQREILREAHMRKCLRQAQKEGFSSVAVVCGAWHVPALTDLPPAKADNELLKGLPRVKVAATWAPWSYRNLSSASGYGAGVTSPGWYEHLWQAPSEQRAVGWLARAARLFREEGLDCSSAHIIEAVRLAETLAALRERPQAGLDELNEALRTVVCLGDDAPMRLIERALTVGDRLGRIPASAPVVPLQHDLNQQQKRLRLKVEAVDRTLNLDLRESTDLARSHLLHRLNLLAIPWGKPQRTGRSAKGSFHEIWMLQWEPALAMAVIEASRWGNTIADAASAKAVDQARAFTTLPPLAALVHQVLLADLPTAIAPVTQALEDLAAVASDLGQLLGAIPPLVTVARYGNVRQTDVGMVEQVLKGLIPRAAIGLPGACTALDDEAAQILREAIAATHQAVRLLADEDLRDGWLRSLERVAGLPNAHGLLSGLAARLLFDEHIASADDTARYMSQVLSPGNEPVLAAAWLDGFLNQSGLVLLHDDPLWTLVDGWLNSLTEDRFRLILPLLRRAFSGFTAPERRQLGERATRPDAAVAAASVRPDWDDERAERVLPLFRQLLGVPG